MAESIIDPFKGVKILNPRALADKLKSLLKKLLQEEAEYIGKFTVAVMRSMFNKELKQYLNLTEMTTLQCYLIKCVQCRAEGKPVYQQEAKLRPENRDSRENTQRKKVTCYHCGNKDCS